MKMIRRFLSITAITSMPLSGAINMQTVFVGDAGNPADHTGYGAVNYEYHIGAYEVTNAQYAEFLNNKAQSDPNNLYNASMTAEPLGGIFRSGSSGNYTYSVKTGMGDSPVNFVSFWDASRFTNWLTNGQGSGDTETGMYALNGVVSPTNNEIERDLEAWSNGGVAIASLSEWYKAAYYDSSPEGPIDDYWSWATASDVMPGSDAPESLAPNSANHQNHVGELTDVGSYGNSASHYGTYDQYGNVAEWNDTIVFSETGRSVVGGTFRDAGSNSDTVGATGSIATMEHDGIGFRVTRLEPIPEPAVYGLLLGVSSMALAARRRHN